MHKGPSPASRVGLFVYWFSGRTAPRNPPVATVQKGNKFPNLPEAFMALGLMDVKITHARFLERINRGSFHSVSHKAGSREFLAWDKRGEADYYQIEDFDVSMIASIHAACKSCGVSFTLFPAEAEKVSEDKAEGPASPVKREKIIKIRVSPEELETLKFNSTKVQLAEWMRETCLNPGQVDLVRDLVQPEPVDPALLRALAGIGNNMNQIARRINTGEWDSLDVVKIVAALGAIERELSELRALHR